MPQKPGILGCFFPFQRIPVIFTAPPLPGSQSVHPRQHCIVLACVCAHHTKFGGCPPPPPHAGGGRCAHRRTPTRYLWGPWDAPQTNRPSTNTHTWRGWPLGMPVRTRFFGGPTCAAPAWPQIWVTHIRPPTQTRGLYSRRGPSGRSGFPGLPGESEASLGTYKPNPVVHGKALTRPGFFCFSHTCGTHRPATAWITERVPRPAHTQAGTSLRPPQP